MTQSIRSWAVGLVAALLTLTTGGTAMAASGSLRHDSATSESPKVAIITPTLDILVFGTSLGSMEACGVGGSAGQAGLAAVPGVPKELGGTLSDVSLSCADTGADAAVSLSEARSAVGPLAVINPAVNPSIELLASTLESVGTDYGPSLAPFGPAVVTLGADVRFFAGS